MTERTRTVQRVEQLAHGALLGILVGVVVGGVEYLRLMTGMIIQDPATAWWRVAVPHALMGMAGGVVLALPARRLTRGLPASRVFARLAAVLGAAAGLAYVGLSLSYDFVADELDATSIALYAGAVLGALLLGLVLDRGLAVLSGRLEQGAGGPGGLRLALPGAVLVLIALVLLAPAGHRLVRGRGTQPAVAGGGGKATGPNIVFILIDTLRKDHLPMYGYSRNTSPALAEFARQGLVFTTAYAQASYTRASVATLFSSLYPSVHKANADRDFLPSSVPLLPESLRAAGYQTFAISANAQVSPTFGYARGFDAFRVWKTESEFRVTLAGRILIKLLGYPMMGRLLNEPRELVPTADSITDATLEWVDEAGREPFFLYVQYIDPHDPYRAPAPYDRSFDHRADPPRRAGVDPLATVSGADRAKVAKDLDDYDGEIRFVDHHTGRLLKGLEQRGLLSNTLVIITSDHGEEFYDHAQDNHGRTAYEEVVRVPLIFWWPDRIPAGSTSDALVGLIDLMPTILDVAGLEPPPGVQGRSLAALLRDPSAPWSPRPLLMQVISKMFEIEAMRDGSLKYIRYARGAREGQEELYDLATDPLERSNLVEQRQARVASLRKTLDAFNDVLDRYSSAIPAEQIDKMDRDTERALRSLGYIK
jgi:arylsulfatase A-like enzyme